MIDSPDRLNTRVWLMLTVVGAVLALIAWYRFLG
jgi:hypothetical protein